MRHRPLTRFAHVALVLGLVVGTSLSAYAQGASPEEHAQRARVAYDLQDYDKAIDEYRAAYRIDQKPAYLWALAQAQRMGGDFQGAIASYKAFKRGDVTQSQANAAEMLITKCEAEQAKAEAEQAKRANAPKPVTTTPDTSEGTARAAPPPAEPEPDQPEAPARWYTDPLGHVLFFGGLVAAGVGTGFLVVGNNQVVDTSGSYDAVLDRQDGGKTKQIVGTTCLAAGGALMLGGLVRYLVVGDGGAEPDATAALSILPDQASIAVSGRF